MACDRCGNKNERLYPLHFTDECGEEHDWMICWDCDFEISNGRGDIMEDYYDIYCQRMADAYNEDPVNNSHLWRYAT